MRVNRTRKDNQGSLFDSMAFMRKKRVTNMRKREKNARKNFKKRSGKKDGDKDEDDDDDDDIPPSKFIFSLTE